MWGQGRYSPGMKVGMEVLVLNFLLIQRLVTDVGLQVEGVVEEAFLQAQGCLSSDRWVLGWVLGFVLLWVFVL